VRSGDTWPSGIAAADSAISPGTDEAREEAVSVSQETTTQGTRSSWYAAEASAVARELGVEPERGLSVEEARSRLQSHGPNRLAGAKKESGLQAFLR
jgi:magnesium-transporting ATPase (P-type)